MQKQPAKVNYYFKKGYVEFGRTIAAIFKSCGRIISRCWDDVLDSLYELITWLKEFITLGEFWLGFGKSVVYGFLSGYHIGRLILSAVFIPVICVVLSIFQGVALLLIMFTFYILYLLASWFDFLYRSIKKISTDCPRCQEKYSLPIYVCTCGRQHNKLVPSKYGVLTRVCDCGKKIKTTFFNGRHKQPGKWICHKCGYELGGPLQVSIPIPVVGGPSSGKTCYINMAIAEIEKKALSEYALNFEYKPNVDLGDDYEFNKNSMTKGKLPQKTSDTRLKYYQFYLTPKGEKVRNLISICDVAGETYESNTELGSQIGYKYANAFIMVLDPLSISKFREEMKDSIDLRKYGASERSMDEVLNALIITLENIYCLNSKAMIHTDVAVVFTKCDIPGLEEKIGDSAVREYSQLHNVKTKYEAQNAVCENFLMEYEEENFLNSLKSKFKSIQFFTCSALGHVENGKGFNASGVEEPALWLIDKTSASINLKNKWGEKI